MSGAKATAVDVPPTQPLRNARQQQAALQGVEEQQEIQIPYRFLSRFLNADVLVSRRFAAVRGGSIWTDSAF